MYYTVEEMLTALDAANKTINHRTFSGESYTRGWNDCMAFLIEYDKELRGTTRAYDIVDFEWKNTKDFMLKLARKGVSLSQFAEYCGYEVITSKRPKAGDIAFDNGAMISDGRVWISTKENNTGVDCSKQMMFLERNFKLIARPLRG
jgi:hypothetical protein